MSKLSNQKLKLLYLLKILMEKTDTEHTLTVPEMINELNTYNINAENRKFKVAMKQNSLHGKFMLPEELKL